MSLTEAHAVRYFLLTSTTLTPWKAYMEMFIVVVTQQWSHHAVSSSWSHPDTRPEAELQLTGTPTQVRFGLKRH